MNQIFPPIGMRNIKTALSVLICLLFYLLCGFLHDMLPTGNSLFYKIIAFLLNRYNAIYACVGAIVSMQSTVEDSVSNGTSRLVGTAVGGMFGIGTLMLGAINHHPFLSCLVYSLGVMFSIYICNIIKKNNASAIACVVYLIIVLSVDSGVHAVPYAINRVLDTAIGIIISVLINYYIKAPKKNVESPAAAVITVEQQEEFKSEK